MLLVATPLFTLNSMNCDKIQICYGYQGYPCQAIDIFPDEVVKKKIKLLPIGRYLFSAVSSNSNSDILSFTKLLHCISMRGYSSLQIYFISCTNIPSYMKYVLIIYFAMCYHFIQWSQCKHYSRTTAHFGIKTL